MNPTTLTPGVDLDARDFVATSETGFDLTIQYAPHAHRGIVETVHNVKSVHWLYNIAQGLTGINSGEVGYDSPIHGFGGSLRFYDYIDNKLLPRFTSLTISPATARHSAPTNS